MAKVALLIGVSEYEPGLTPLPAATKDVEAMQQVLLNPQIGGFDDVTLLINPQRQTMDEAIERLFSDRQRDDLLLLFFSGHGIKDEKGNLYFAACNTKKSDKGELVKATTVPASSVHSVMSNSRCKREVVILDCCFSGAFAEGMAAKNDGFVDVKNQLGGEGRAVLTSSTSTQFAFEQQGADTSTYTTYIVEGLKTGAADKNEDGWISVDELHEYATKAVQEATPAMKPEIYAIKEGYKINLAKAPIDDPKLIYRREVDYWVRDGEIINMGRIPLIKRQKELGLKPDEASGIEAEVLKPYQDYKENLQEYQKAFIEATKGKLSVSDNTHADLKRLQQALGLRDEDIALIEAPIIAENSSSSTPPPPRKNNFLQYIGACIIGIVIGGTVIYALFHRDTSSSCAMENYISSDRISFGEKILLKQDTNSDKEAGVRALAQGDCLTAISKFQAYRKTNPSDPEALIYLNNAKARQQGNRLKIAVSVPIGESPNIAQEMLRGVAQAQNEVNSGVGINGKALEVAIANDDNKPEIVSNIATKFVQDPSILAVVGHNASRASLAAALVYQYKLVMISPTSYFQDITPFGKGENSYIFRTAPSIVSIVSKVSSSAINDNRKSNFLICFDENPDNESGKNYFVKAIREAGGTINPIDCNISDSQFKPETVLFQARNKGANALLLAFYLDKSRDKTGQGRALVRANQGRLALFSTPAQDTEETLEEGQNINNMIISVPWHPQAFRSSLFGKNAENLWGETVNWRTATSYDATLAIVKGLQQSNTRKELKKILHSPTFSFDGATGKIQFSQSGDRINNPAFSVKVQRIPGTDKYHFVPIQP
ncbi:MAG: ABC transporter substrate-binding protein [Nostoc sp.]|uniref:caspase, EACC1-associated type n=1 Tax=Nostoc sp. TaxID=1180 RepID=UPI002FFC0602